MRNAVPRFFPGSPRSLAALCAFKDEPGEQVKAILRAARLAPSSFNSQPWRFVVYSDRIYIFAKKTRPFSGKESEAFKEFNIGIMLSHIMLAAEELLDEHGDAGGGAVREEGLQERGIRLYDHVPQLIKV